MKIEKLEYYTGGTTHRDGSISWKRHPDINDIVDKINEIIDKLNEMDDTEPVVRCKDCKYVIPYESGGYNCLTCPNVGSDVDENWFCADGERSEDEVVGRCKH